MVGVTKQLTQFGGVDMDFPGHSTRSNFCKFAELVAENCPLPTAANSRIHVHCKRLVNPSLQKVIRFAVAHGATALTVGAGTPKFKFAVYRIGANGRPTTKVAGMEGTINLRTTGASYNGIADALDAPVAFPKCGSFVIAWVANTTTLTTPSAATFYGSSDINLGADASGLQTAWTEKHDLLVTVPEMFTNDATFNAFVFPDTFALLNPSAWANNQNRAASAGMDWFWVYEQNADI